MQIRFDHAGHKALWNWLTENPEKYKQDWPDFDNYDRYLLHINNNCFACVAAKGRDCKRCPLNWHDPKTGRLINCLDPYSPYVEWTRLGGDYLQDESESERQARLKKRSMLAKQIAEMPLRDDLEIVLVDLTKE